MNEEKKDDEATVKVNAPEPTKEKTSSDKENLADSKDDKVKVVPEPEEIAEGYLGEEPKDEIDYKKRYGDSTREYQVLKKQTESDRQNIEDLKRLAQINPRILAEIEAAYRQPGQADSTLVDQRINEAIAPIKQGMQDLQNKDVASKVKVLANFEKKNPKLFPANATREQKQEIRQKLGKVVNVLVETGMSYKNAVERAHLTINPKAAVQKGKDEAYLESLGERQAGFPSQASTQGKKPSKPKYSKRELEIGDRMGVGEAMREDKS
jgi:hypothetical protein